MAKLLCNLCLSKEHNSQNCPRLQRNVTPPVGRPLVTLQRTVREGHFDTVTLRPACLFCDAKDAEIERLEGELAKLRGRNAERQRAYRERRGVMPHPDIADRALAEVL